MSLTWASCAQDEKGNFYSVLSFLIVFDHANTCASMRSLVEIHNNEMNGKFESLRNDPISIDFYLNDFSGNYFSIKYFWNFLIQIKVFFSLNKSLHLFEMLMFHKTLAEIVPL